MDRCLVGTVTDQVHICGELVCSGILEDTTEKHFFSEGPAQQGRIVELSWLKEEMPSARAGDSVIYKNQTFKIKPGFPVDLRDCWMMAELSTCETC